MYSAAIERHYLDATARRDELLAQVARARRIVSAAPASTTGQPRWQALHRQLGSYLVSLGYRLQGVPPGAIAHLVASPAIGRHGTA